MLEEYHITDDFCNYLVFVFSRSFLHSKLFIKQNLSCIVFHKIFLNRRKINYAIWKYDIFSTFIQILWHEKHAGYTVFEHYIRVLALQKVGNVLLIAKMFSGRAIIQAVSTWFIPKVQGDSRCTVKWPRLGVDGR